MTMTLKNLKVHQDMSEETTCFSASIYWKGKRVGTAMNHGHGGCNQYSWTDHEAGRELEAWADAQELYYTNYEGEETEVTFEKLDHLVDEEIQSVEADRWMKRQTKRHILLRLEGDEEGAFRTYPNQGRPEKVAELIREKFGEKIIELHF